LLVPLFFFGAIYYGPIGTGIAWSLTNGLYAVLWVPVVHARVFKGFHWKWMVHDILPIAVPTALVGWLLAKFIPMPTARWSVLASLLPMGLALLIVACLGSSMIRGILKALFTRLVSRFSNGRFMAATTRQ
jgi:hypothetical protein